MIAGKVLIGDIVQIDPEHDERFAACFMVVTEIRAWGYIGYFTIPGEKGLAWYRVPNDKCVRVGHGEWVKADVHDSLPENAEKA